MKSEVDDLLKECARRDTGRNPSDGDSLRWWRSILNRINSGHPSSRAPRLWLVLAVLVTGGIFCAALAPKPLEHPICVVMEQRDGLPLKGLDQADYVYEWRQENGSSKLVAVFTRAAKCEIGPISSLEWGCFEISRIYGRRTVCTSIHPDFHGEVDRLYQSLYLSLAQLSGPYIHLDEAVARLKGAPDTPTVVETPGHPNLPDGLAHTISIEGPDDSQFVTWRWDERNYRYEREIEGKLLESQAVVIIVTDPNASAPLPEFPSGPLADDRGKAMLFARGERADVSWWRRFSAPVCLEDWRLPRDIQVPFPPGRLWFHIVKKEDSNRVRATWDGDSR